MAQCSDTWVERRRFQIFQAALACDKIRYRLGKILNSWFTMTHVWNAVTSRWTPSNLTNGIILSTMVHCIPYNSKYCWSLALQQRRITANCVQSPLPNPETITGYPKEIRTQKLLHSRADVLTAWTNTVSLPGFHLKIMFSPASKCFQLACTNDCFILSIQLCIIVK